MLVELRWRVLIFIFNLNLNSTPYCCTKMMRRTYKAWTLFLVRRLYFSIAYTVHNSTFCHKWFCVEPCLGKISKYLKIVTFNSDVKGKHDCLDCLFDTVLWYHLVLLLKHKNFFLVFVCKLKETGRWG